MWEFTPLLLYSSRVLYNKGNSNKSQMSLPPELEGDERLKNIEPKMVELIMNEVRACVCSCIHLLFSLSPSLFLSLCLSLSLSPSIYLSLSIYLSIYLSIFVSLCFPVSLSR